MAKGMGFKSAAAHAAKHYEDKGMSHEKAMQIGAAAVAKASREASPAAKHKNPNLKKVRGK